MQAVSACAAAHTKKPGRSRVFRYCAGIASGDAFAAESLEGFDRVSLQALLALGDDEADLLAFLQGLEAL